MSDWEGKELVLGGFRSVRSFMVPPFHSKLSLATPVTGQLKAISHASCYPHPNVEYVAACRGDSAIWNHLYRWLAKRHHVERHAVQMVSMSGGGSFHYSSVVLTYRISKQKVDVGQMLFDYSDPTLGGQETTVFSGFVVEIKEYTIEVDPEDIFEEMKHDAPLSDCRCGFYSFYSMELLERSYGSSWGIPEKSKTATAVIENYGKVIHGTKGLRSERMKIIGVVFNTPEGWDVDENYPNFSSVAYPSEEEMFEALPLSSTEGLFDETN